VGLLVFGGGRSERSINRKCKKICRPLSSSVYDREREERRCRPLSSSVYIIVNVKKNDVGLSRRRLYIIVNEIRTSFRDSFGNLCTYALLEIRS
jgi:hypothetical protein